MDSGQKDGWVMGAALLDGYMDVLKDGRVDHYIFGATTVTPWRKAWPPTPVFLPGESRGQRSLAGYSPWGRKESDTTGVA